MVEEKTFFALCVGRISRSRNTNGYISKSSNYFFGEKTRRFLFAAANVIQALGDGFISDLQSHAVPASKIVVIPPWLDTDFIRPLQRQNSFSHEQGLNGDFVVLYSGNLGLSQGLENVLFAAKILSHLQAYSLCLCWDGANRGKLVTQASELGLQNVKFIPFQTRERLPEVLATSDVSLVSLQGGIGNSSLPSKTFPILASGRPVLAVADKESGLWNLVQQSKGGMCVPRLIQNIWLKPSRFWNNHQNCAVRCLKIRGSLLYNFILVNQPLINSRPFYKDL